MSGRDTMITFPVGPFSAVSFRMVSFSRSCRYVQNCVCFLDG